MKSENLIIAKKLSAGALIDILINNNQISINEALSLLGVLIQTAEKIDGQRRPEVRIISRAFSQLKIFVEQHLIKEERFVFPIVKRISEEEKAKKSDLALIETSAAELRDEHEKINLLLLRIKLLSDNYDAPINCSPSLKEFYRKFILFNKSLKEHIYMVEEILLGDFRKLKRNDTN